MTIKTKLPAILMAHDLFSGGALYWQGENWSPVFETALLVQNTEDHDAIEKTTAQEIAKNQVCDAELIEVIKSETNDLKPRHFRDSILIYGPTIAQKENA